MDNLDPKSLLSTMHNEILLRNERSMFVWSKYKEDVKTTQELLKTLPKELNHQVLVPLGRKAFLPGKIVHTNEFLVSIGSGYFSKKTANQSVEFCERKIKDCDEMLEKLEKELELFGGKQSMAAGNDAFGGDQRPEIVEHVTEEEEKAWREEHRKREKEYRQKLAKMKTEEKKKIANESDLWERLDQLELEEELEDELNRLHNEEDSDEGEENDETSENDDENDQETSENEREISNNESSEEPVKNKRKKSVIFNVERETPKESVIEEPLRLEFKHTDATGTEKSANPSVINSPTDIYEKYVRDMKNSAPVSILKVKKNPNQNFEEAATRLQEEEEEEEETVPIISSGFELKDIFEKQDEVLEKPVFERSPRRVSKFKASRMKK